MKVSSFKRIKFGEPTHFLSFVGRLIIKYSNQTKVLIEFSDEKLHWLGLSSTFLGRLGLR